MEYFQFKKFKIIQNSASVFKVNTEAVLVCACAEVSNARKILEIGSGTGVISIGLQQRLEADSHTTAIDIDFEAYSLTQKNIEINNIRTITAHHISLQEFVSKEHNEKFDLIVSNPPYYNEKFKSTKTRNTLAKYTDTLNFETLIQSSSALLNNNGHLVIIIPFQDLAQMEKIIEQNLMQITRQLNIKTVPRKKNPLRVLLTIMKRRELDTIRKMDELLVKDINNEFTTEYKQMTNEYYTIF